MLKITSKTSSDHGEQLRLEGRLTGASVEILRDECHRLLERDATVVLDLGQIAFVDRDGLALLRRLERRGVRLLNLTPFVAEALGAKED
jgi:ABC-type transporter Mla MlaB component